MDAFDLLNHNCWRFVFRKLDAEDLFSCSLVCQSFSELLDEDRFQRRWKFELILRLLFPYLKSWNYRRDAEVWEGLGNMRLVCEGWRKIVDKYAEEFEPNYFSTRTKFLPLATCLKSSEKIQDFLQMFGESNGNPFPAKTLEISRFYERLEGGGNWDHPNLRLGLQQTQAYIEKVTNFMGCFGRKIFKLDLNINLQFFNTDCLFMCELIKRVLIHLPTLKTFRVAGYNYEDAGQRVRDGQQLATWIEENELSDLPNLKALKIEGMNQTAEKYLVEKYANQLVHFERKYASAQNPQMQLQVGLFGNLRKLALELVDPVEDTLEPLRFLESPLKFLKLEVRCSDEVDLVYLNTAKVLRNLRHLPLEYLKIRAHAYVKVAEADLGLDEYINESIRTLAIHLDHWAHEHYVGEISFNFLQALRKLETLKLKFQTGMQGRKVRIIHPQDLPEEVRLHEYLARREEGADMLYESNVWERLASLKTLVVKVKWPQWQPMGNYCYRRIENYRSKSTFTREEYEMVRRNRNVLNELGLINLN